MYFLNDDPDKGHKPKRAGLTINLFYILQVLLEFWPLQKWLSVSIWQECMSQNPSWEERLTVEPKRTILDDTHEVLESSSLSGSQKNENKTPQWTWFLPNIGSLASLILVFFPLFSVVEYHVVHTQGLRCHSRCITSLWLKIAWISFKLRALFEVDL